MQFKKNHVSEEDKVVKDFLSKNIKPILIEPDIIQTYQNVQTPDGKIKSIHVEKFEIKDQKNSDFKEEEKWRKMTEFLLSKKNG